MNKSRTDQLQFLRFCAFIPVFLVHITEYEMAWFPGLMAGISAVEFFILLGGVLTGYSSYNKEIEFSVKGIVTGLWKKIKKLYPLYFITVIFGIMRSGMPIYVTMRSFGELKTLLLQLVKCLLLIQSWFPDDYFAFNGVAWFLSTVMFLYIFNVPFTAIATKIKKKSHANLIFGAIFVVFFGLSVLYCYLRRDTDVSYTLYVFPLSRIGEYICGLSLGYILYPLKEKFAGSTDDGAKSKAVWTLAEVASIAFVIYVFMSPVENWQFPYVRWMIPNSILISVFIFGGGYLSKLFQNDILRYLGDISFECYLIHQPLINLYSTTSGIGNENTLGNMFALVYCLGLIVIIAAFVSGKKIRKTPAKQKA